MSTPKNILTIAGAEWCGHCKNLQKDYETNKDAYEAANIEYNFVDCANDKGNEACEGVQGFPTLRNGCGDVQAGYRPFEDVIAFATQCNK